LKSLQEYLTTIPEFGQTNTSLLSSCQLGTSYGTTSRHTRGLKFTNCGQDTTRPRASSRDGMPHRIARQNRLERGAVSRNSLRGRSSSMGVLSQLSQATYVFVARAASVIQIPLDQRDFATFDDGSPLQIPGMNDLVRRIAGRFLLAHTRNSKRNQRQRNYANRLHETVAHLFVSVSALWPRTYVASVRAARCFGIGDWLLQALA
jgi:hypothetical protein